MSAKSWALGYSMWAVLSRDRELGDDRPKVVAELMSYADMR